MPVELRREVRMGQQYQAMVNLNFGHYKGIREDLADVDYSLVSCGQLYAEECQKLGIKPNAGIMDQLPKTPGKFTLHDINAACTYVGEKGLIALFPVIEANRDLRKLKLSDNGLQNPSVLALLKILQSCENVISLDLSKNKALSLEVGTAALALTKQNRNFMNLSLARSQVSKPLQDSIEKQLKDNRRKNGEKNKKLLQDRKRMDRAQFFQLKAVFDELDKDRSGVVSLAELQKLAQKRAQKGGERRINHSHDTAVFGAIDKDDDGEVTLIEYAQAAFPNVPRDEILHSVDCFSDYAYPEYVPPAELSNEQIEEMSAIFKLYDKSGDGVLSLKELKDGMSRSAMCIDVEEYFQSFDKSDDGMLDLPEFIEMLKQYYT